MRTKPNRQETYPAMLEPHYSAKDLADKWGFRADFVRRMFKDEEGVVLVTSLEKMHKRGYTSMRIPASVAERVYARLVSRGRPTSAVAADPDERKRA